MDASINDQKLPRSPPPPPPPPPPPLTSNTQTPTSTRVRTATGENLQARTVAAERPATISAEDLAIGKQNLRSVKMDGNEQPNRPARTAQASSYVPDNPPPVTSGANGQAHSPVNIMAALVRESAKFESLRKQNDDDDNASNSTTCHSSDWEESSSKPLLAKITNIDTVSADVLEKRMKSSCRSSSAPPVDITQPPEQLQTEHRSEALAIGSSVVFVTEVLPSTNVADVAAEDTTETKQQTERNTLAQNARVKPENLTLSTTAARSQPPSQTSNSPTAAAGVVHATESEDEFYDTLPAEYHEDHGFHARRDSAESQISKIPSKATAPTIPPRPKHWNLQSWTENPISSLILEEPAPADHTMFTNRTAQPMATNANSAAILMSPMQPAKSDLKHESKTEAHTQPETMHETAMRFWQYFVGDGSSIFLQYKLCEISNTLHPHTLHCSDEQIRQVFQSGPDVLPPLIRVAALLLPKARRYQPWKDDVYKLDDWAQEHHLGFPIDSKGLLLMLQFYLPRVQGRQLYRRLSEQNAVLPFAAYMPTEHKSNLKAMHILLHHFRDLLGASVPILVSLGVPECRGKGKSTFLNKCFSCAFPQSSNDIEYSFHEQSIDLSLSTESKPQNFHILDCHGTLPADIIRLITSIATVAIVHVTQAALQEGSSAANTLRHLLGEIDADCKMLLLVRDSAETGNLPSFTFAEEIQHRYLGSIAVMHMGSASERFERAFHKLVDTKIKPLLDNIAINGRMWPTDRHLQTHRYFSLYEQVEQSMSEKKLSCCGVHILLKIRSAHLIGKARKQKLLLHKRPTTQREAWKDLFPRSAAHLELCMNKMNIDDLTLRVDVNEGLRKRVAELELGIRNQNELSQLLKDLVDIVDRHSIDEFEEFMAVASTFCFQSSQQQADGTSKTAICRLAAELFWRELLLFAQNNDKTLFISLREFFRLLLASGYALEIINGETLTFIDMEFLESILASEKHQKQLFVSVIGPQSSGKSTLMNHLVGSGFAVNAGRCTRGMYLSVFEMPNNERIAVLDSEGLLSMATRDSALEKLRGTAFDNKMAVMLLALSDVVLVNVKGELTVDMDHILEVALLGMKKLDIIHLKPKLMMVLRDLTSLDPEMQSESMVRIDEGMKNICEKIQFEFTKLSQGSYALMPSAFSLKSRRPFHSAAIRDPNIEFLLLIEDLFMRIRNSNSPLCFVSMDKWVRHAKSTWNSLQQAGGLLHYKTLQEYFDREQLSKFVSQLFPEFDDQFRERAKNISENIINNATFSSPASALNGDFRKEVEAVLADLLKRVAGSFNDQVADRNFLSDLVEEYKRRLDQRCRMALHSVLGEFDMKLGRFLVSGCVQANIDKVKQLIDDYVRTRGEQPLEMGHYMAEFDHFWEQQHGEMMKQLKRLIKTPEKINSDLSSIFDDVLAQPNFSKYAIRGFRLCATSYVSVLLNDRDCQKISKYITIGTIQKWKATLLRDKTVREVFQASIKEVQECVIKVVANVRRVCNAASIQQYVQALEAKIQKFDKQIQEHGAKFELKFYNLWFLFLFEKYFEKLQDDEQAMIATNLSIFENNKEQLFVTFTNLLRSRYDDGKSARDIAVKMSKAINAKANNEAGDQLLSRLRNVGKKEPDELLEICESRNSAAEVYANIVDCPKFMARVFTERFDAEQLKLFPHFESTLKTNVNGLVDDLHSAISSWQRCLEEQEREIEAVLNAGSETKCKEMYQALFLSFKAFLSGDQQPQQALPFFVDSNFSLIGSDWSFLFAILPNTLVICNPSKFCELLHASIDDFYRDNETLLILDEELLRDTRSGLLETALGCQKVCPLCGAKCSLPGSDGHAKHETTHHRMTAFSGWHGSVTLELVFDICTSAKVYEHMWKECRLIPDNEQEALPFDQFMAKYHSDWLIPLIPDAKVEVKNIMRWMQAQDELVEYYSRPGRRLISNTPPDWLDVVGDYCPVCVLLWAECSHGEKRQLPCKHYIGAECLATLRGKNVVERACPMCRGPLDCLFPAFAARWQCQTTLEVFHCSGCISSWSCSTTTSGSARTYYIPKYNFKR